MSSRRFKNTPEWEGPVSRVEAAGRVIRAARHLATIVANKDHLDRSLRAAVAELSTALELYDAAPPAGIRPRETVKT